MSDAAWDRIKQSIDNLRRGEMGTKTCSGCKLPLPLDCFHRRNSRPAGRQSRCKDCLKLGPSSQSYRARADRALYTPAPYADEYNAWLQVRGADTGPVTWTIRRAA